jgi:NADH oxidoreductase Hcr
MHPGRIDEALLRTVSDLTHSIAFICGPQPMIEGTAGLLGSLRVPSRQIRYELFEAAVAASARAREGAWAGASPAAADTFRLTASRSGQQGEIGPGQTLLEAAEQHGIEISSICRAGVCGTCRTRVIEGDVDCTSDLLDEEDRSVGYVLACVASARSDCVLEL